jgi:N-acetylglutamate synthase-like GNAT family acetyltransferase
MHYKYEKYPLFGIHKEGVTTTEETAMFKTITIRKAQDTDLPAMKDLIRRTYAAKGYLLSHDGDCITYPDPKDKNTIALVATHLNVIVGTLSLHMGNSRTLPINDVFSEEVKIVADRAKNARLGYIGRLAVHEEHRALRVTPLLFRRITLHCILHNVAAVICVVNPHHEHFYLRRGFELIAKKEETPGLQNAPASILAFYLKERSIWSTIRNWMFAHPKHPP